MKKLLIALLLAVNLAGLAQESDTGGLAKAKELEAKLQYQNGEINLRHDLAKLTVPENFRYLSPEDSEIVLSKFWGNPANSHTLGMILPADLSPLDQRCWAVVITFTEDGYVKDSDADKINYDDLLKQMKEATKENNEERVKEGYPAIDLVGWATPPRYDKATHKMYWAKELRFSDADTKENTLNYNIRVLGRRGVLVLNAVAGMNDFKMIEQHTPEIVSMVDFNEGHRYTDFDGKTDKVAAYGLAALIAGGIAAKAGFFKMLWVGLLAAKKLVIVGVIALVGLVKKIFGKKEEV